MKNFKEFAIPTVALFLICLVATTLLAVTNKVTAPKIAELSAQTEVETRQKVLPAAPYIWPRLNSAKRRR